MTTSDSPASLAPREPSLAERARTLLHLARYGTLCTQSRKLPGFPFGSLAAYGLEENGQPTLHLSALAVHTQNLAADEHASLFVAQPGPTGDALAVGRVTLLGTVARLSSSDVDAVRRSYLQRHEGARRWADFGDFAFYRMDLTSIYCVAGFGRMGWVDVGEYRNARPDPLAESGCGILAHMNADHRDALTLYCRAFAGVEADEVAMTEVDRFGFAVRVAAADGPRSLRINFPREVDTAQAARSVLIEMVREARSRTEP